MLSVSCSGCGTSFFVADESAGHEVRCGTCGKMLVVPVPTRTGMPIEPVEGAWEYEMVADRGRLGRVDQVKLNELGAQGWELVTVFRENQEAHMIYYFKRPFQAGKK